MDPKPVVIEGWGSDGVIRIPDEALKKLGVGVGDTLFVIEEYVGTMPCFVLSKTPQISDRTDELVSYWDRGKDN